MDLPWLGMSAAGPPEGANRSSALAAAEFVNEAASVVAHPARV